MAGLSVIYGIRSRTSTDCRRVFEAYRDIRYMSIIACEDVWSQQIKEANK